MMKPEAGGGTLLVATVLAAVGGWLAAGWLGVASLAHWRRPSTCSWWAGWRPPRSGGITGDSCGAVGTLVEAAVLLAGVAALGE